MIDGTHTKVVASPAGGLKASGSLGMQSGMTRWLRAKRSRGVPIGAAENPHIKELTGRVTVQSKPPPNQYLIALLSIGGVTLAAFLFTPVIGAHATALIFLLTVVLLALFVQRGPTLAAAAMSALLWDYFFLQPIYALRIDRFEDTMLFGMYFVVALVLGHLTTRIRSQEEAERERESRATLLYLLTRDLNESVSLDQMVDRIVQQLGSCFGAKVAILLPGLDKTLKIHAASTLEVEENQREVSQWVFEHRQRAGTYTDNLAAAGSLFIPLLTTSGPVGVLGLRFEEGFGPAVDRGNLIETISQQIAMALDRHRLNGISEKAKLLAESERLSKALLDSMSHEIKTPIAAIKSATGNLAELPESDSQMRQAMVAELQQATDRLNRLVSNILEASRLESGAVKPSYTECDIGELIHVTLAETEKDLSAHKVSTRVAAGLPLVSLDFVLTQQALINLLSNCAFHTPPGTPIEVGARLDHESVILWVADAGPGIPADSLPRIFDKFYRVPNSRTGGSGLGLSLVKGFVEAQGGQVMAENRPDGGVVFTIRLLQSATLPVAAREGL